MKKITLLIIFVLILAISLVKNSTKEIEDKIFVLNENIRSLKIEFGDGMLEYNFLSSPEKLIQYQSQFFQKDLIKIDIMKVKEIVKEDNAIFSRDFIKKIVDER
jgi:cell division protein FtsL|tara:strand:- start:1449 stop:1760 length:312 start_codon:yes stop_codon:yes gene_type:complete